MCGNMGFAFVIFFVLIFFCGSQIVKDENQEIENLTFGVSNSTAAELGRLLLLSLEWVRMNSIMVHDETGTSLRPFAFLIY